MTAVQDWREFVGPWQVPCCDRCGAEITTGMMAAICPYESCCEFWPEDERSVEFIRFLGFRRATPQEWGHPLIGDPPEQVLLFDRSEG